MKKNDDLIQEYIQYSEAHRKFIQDGDHRKANNAYRSLTRLYRKFEKDKMMAESCLKILCSAKEPAVRLWASAHALGLNMQTDLAEKILEEISQNDKKGLLGLSADMTLKEWKKNGKLKF